MEKSNASVKLDAFLIKAKELSDNIASLNASDDLVEENQDMELDDHIQLELSRGQELLKKMLDEQAIVTASIITSRQQIVDLNNADLLSAKENTAPTNSKKSVDIILDDAELRSIEKSQKTWVTEAPFSFFIFVSDAYQSVYFVYSKIEHWSEL